MCGGAVNRQPGYRARDLQRRGLEEAEGNKGKKLKKSKKVENFPGLKREAYRGNAPTVRGAKHSSKCVAAR